MNETEFVFLDPGPLVDGGNHVIGVTGAELPAEVEPPTETAPPLVTSKGAIIFGACSLIILIVVGILFLIDPFGGAA